MKKIVMYLLMLFIVFQMGYAESDIVSKMKSTTYNEDLEVKDISLEDFLIDFSKKTKINIVADTQIKETAMKFYINKGVDVYTIINTIKITNNFESETLNGVYILKSKTRADISGVVKDADTGEGIKGATITIDNSLESMQLTDVGGVFIFKNVLYGKKIINVTIKGYTPNAQLVNVNNETSEIEILLKKAKPISIFGE